MHYHGVAGSRPLGRGRAGESGQKQAAGHIKQTKQTEEAEQETAEGRTARHL